MIPLNELHDLTIPVAEDWNYNFRALKAAVETIEALAASMIPAAPGTMTEFGGDTAPTGWLLCNGQEVSRTTYSALFAAIGTKFGTGDGAATFNVPDCRGRVSVGAGTGTALTPRLLGGRGGEETHLLTASEMPSHGHVTPDGFDFITAQGITGLAAGTDFAWGDPGSNTTRSAGGSVPHNTMPPFVVTNKIIKI